MEETTVYRKYEYDQIEKLVKLIGCTYACNSLTDFEDEELAITGNGNNVNQLTKFVKTHQMNQILGGF